MEIAIKQQLYNFCKDYADSRISRIQNSISGIQESLNSETKSSAGNKHETGRAMLQLEREKQGQQLAEAEKMKRLLSKVNIKNNTYLIGLGSLVRTSRGNYFLAISAGEYKKEGILTYCISAHTPIGKLLLGKTIGDRFVFNGHGIAILDVS